MGFYTMRLLRENGQKRETKQEEPVKEETNTKCEGLTKTGKPCKNDSLDDSVYCKIHQPKEEDE